MAKRYIRDTEDDEQTKPKFQSKRGAKLLDKKSPGTARKMFGGIPKTDRPVNVYKERVTDEDTGKTDAYLWYTTEQSHVVGKEEIVKYNERTQEELPIGEDFTIKFTEQKALEIKDKSFGKTAFYLKDGEETFVVKPADFDTLFLERKPKVESNPIQVKQTKSHQ